MPWTWFGLARLFRRGATAPGAPQIAGEPTESTDTKTRTETDKPIDISRLREFISQPIAVNRAAVKSGKANYSEHLKDRQIEPERWKGLSKAFIIIFGTSLIGQFIFALLFSISLGFSLSCSEYWSWGCQRQVSFETTTAIVRRESRAGLRAWREISSKEITIEPRERELFNFVVFQAVLVAFAFTLGFARWQTGNRQAALNTVFDRKKELNLLFLDKAKKKLLEPLIRGATDPDEMIKAKKMKEASKDQAIAILDKCQSIAELGSNKLIDIGKKVFVFMELDNLEFAYEKYNRGYLDAEQMHRACEILESRCLNKEFRYLAVTQGLVYYNRNFHCIVAACIVRGYLLSGGEIPAVTDPK